MESDAGGWLWLLIDVGFVVLLAAGLIYGTMMWHTRRKSRTIERARDEATRRVYREANE